MFPINPTTIAAGLIVLLSATNVLFYNLWQGAKDDYLLFKAQVEAASAAADAANQKKLEDAAANTNDVARLYGDHIRDLDRTHASRLDGLLRQVRDCQTSARTAEATSGLNGAAPNAGSDSAFVTTCIKLENDCAKTTLMTIHLQDWVRRVCH